jgi:hypothetical protein
MLGLSFLLAKNHTINIQYLSLGNTADFRARDYSLEQPPELSRPVTRSCLVQGCQEQQVFPLNKSREMDILRIRSLMVFISVVLVSFASEDASVSLAL